MSVKRQTITAETECKICGAPAIYQYFGVISCQPCKVFFRRNANLRQETFKCVFDGHCEVNVLNRHVCSYCRLKKCFASGMQAEMIRAPLAKKKKPDNSVTTTTSVARSNQLEQIPTINILRSDQSTLTVDQWNLISNLLHCYDEHSGLSIGQRFMLEQNILPLKCRFKSNLVLDLIQKEVDGAQLLYKNNQDFRLLSTDDQTLLLHRTFPHIGTLSTNFILYKVELSDCPAYYKALELITYPEIIATAKRIAQRVDFDMITMKLLLAIISFSTIEYTIYTNEPPVNLSNIKQIINIQDKYIELTWRYLLYKHGHEYAVGCFSNLIKCMFAITEGVVKTHVVEWVTDKFDSVVELTEKTLVIND